jgi:alpha-tubulin suppressor-like RCC1 family protein
MIACGWSHSVAACVKSSEISVLYVWGKGDSGQLGLGDRGDRLVPTEVVMESNTRMSDDAADRTITSFTPSKIMSVSAGYFHTGLVVKSAANAEGELRVYTWGWGENGQLGHGSLDDELVPRFVESLQGVHAMRISCGGAHTMVTTLDSVCYAFGNNQFGQLGVDDGPYSNTMQPVRRELSLLGTSAEAKMGKGFTKLRMSPTLVRIEGYKVISIACGWWHTVAIVQNSMSSIFTSLTEFISFLEQN